MLGIEPLRKKTRRNRMSEKKFVCVIFGMKMRNVSNVGRVLHWYSSSSLES